MEGNDKPDIDPGIESDLKALEGEIVDDPAPGQGGQGSGKHELSTADICSTVVALLFGIVAARRGEHWNLGADEQKALGEALGAVVDKYLPNMDTGPEAALVITAAIIIAPRLAVDRQESDKEPEKPAAPVQEPGSVDGD